MHTCCLQQGAYFRAMKLLDNEYMHQNDMQLNYTWQTTADPTIKIKYGTVLPLNIFLLFY